MTQICEAIFEDGVFRPVAPQSPKLKNGQHVRLVVETNTSEDHNPVRNASTTQRSSSSAFGKYAHAKISSEEFARLKREEIAREDRPR